MPLQPKISKTNLQLREKGIPPPDNEDGSFNLDGFKYKPGDYDKFTSWFTFANDAERYVRELYFKPFINNKTFFLDVGALCGSWTLPALYFGAQVISVEPDRNFFNILENNVKINNFTKWRGINAAAYDKSTRDDIYDMIDVNLIQLDDIPYTKIDYIKIDVEGAEIEVLHGARDLLKISRPFLWVECHEGEFGTTPEMVRDTMLEIFGPTYIIERKTSVKNSPHLFARPTINSMPYCYLCESELCIWPQQHLNSSYSHEQREV